MNILIITSFFPPDSTIAAVRPYMFAKHLSAMGEKVTVLRTGDFDLKPFDEYAEDNSFEVISALGENCPAEKFRRGEYEGYKTPELGKMHNLPRQVRVPLKAVRDFGEVIRKKPPKYFRKAWASLDAQKETIDRLCKMNRSFDVVFATCGELENIYAGQYAAEKFKAKWIMDFRDSMVRIDNEDYWRDVYGKKATICAIRSADVITAASDGLKDNLNEVCRTSKIQVIHNGFDDSKTIEDSSEESCSFSFCYTGRIYESTMPVIIDFVNALSKMVKDDTVDRKLIRFCYAGSSSKEIGKVFEKAGIKELFVDYGYLSKTETLKLQLSSDVFTVVAWNTKRSKGILTGKFYEGIKIKKPILSLVSGKEPNSELQLLQNKYNYGFCYELCNRKNSLQNLENYILKLYREKTETGTISYTPSIDLYNAFRYSQLAEKLHGIMVELTK